jgi:2-hydroxychromene-2-carboxylate isomerase
VTTEGATRVATRGSTACPSSGPRACRHRDRYFVGCEDIADPAVLASFARATGFDWAAYEEARREGLRAELLRRNVERSLERGVFGSPMFIIDGEPFFGVEKLPVVEQWLETGGW